MKKTVLVTVSAGALLAILFYVFGTLLFRAAQPARPTSLPAVVQEPVEVLLQSLEKEVDTHRPAVIPYLRPGIGDQELQQAESSLGRAIHPEMQTLYRWHNGMTHDMELFPGHGFWSLEQAIRTNRDLQEQYRIKGLSLLMAQEEHWLILFPDSAGDGYYYDPVQDYEDGAVFYNFREAGYYRYFPSIRNLLKALIECYQQGVYLPDGETDFDMENRILNKYSFAIEGQ